MDSMNVSTIPSRITMFESKRSTQFYSPNQQSKAFSRAQGSNFDQARNSKCLKGLTLRGLTKSKLYSELIEFLADDANKNKLDDLTASDSFQEVIFQIPENHQLQAQEMTSPGPVIMGKYICKCLVSMEFDIQTKMYPNLGLYFKKRIVKSASQLLLKADFDTLRLLMRKNLVAESMQFDSSVNSKVQISKKAEQSLNGIGDFSSKNDTIWSYKCEIKDPRNFFELE